MECKTRPRIPAEAAPGRDDGMPEAVSESPRCWLRATGAERTAATRSFDRQGRPPTRVEKRLARRSSGRQAPARDPPVIQEWQPARADRVARWWGFDGSSARSGQFPLGTAEHGSSRGEKTDLRDGDACGIPCHNGQHRSNKAGLKFATQAFLVQCRILAPESGI